MSSIKQNMYRHNIGLSPYACKDSEAIRFSNEVEDIRSPFFHDIDRILYTSSYTRYGGKTQVYTNVGNDHITKRMQHAQYVSKIARTIGRALCLNEDLIEAASLGHDLGHVPFGHFGESILNEISLAHEEGYFHHNVESVRLLMEIEGKGNGSNISLQVLDAILCHNGEFLLSKYAPKPKTKEEFLKEYQETYRTKGFTSTLVPMTLEGCVVRLSDMVAYLGKDIEDAALLGKFKMEEIPLEISQVLGVKNREIVNTIIMDVIQNSLDKPYLQLSEPVFKAVLSLKKFNYEHIYDKALSPEEKSQIKKQFYFLYDTFLEDLQKNRKDSTIYQDFLQYKKDIYQNKNTKERIVLDYIAGMTDDYFLKMCKNLENRL